MADPPEMIKLCPLIYAACGLHKYKKLSAISSTDANRFKGVWASNNCLARSGVSAVKSVRSILGETIFAQILCLPYSTAIDLVMDSKALLLTT